MSSEFWLDNPTILLDKSQITEIWLTKDMSTSGKYNAITRLVIILSVLGFIFTKSANFIISGIVTLIIIVAMYKRGYCSNVTEKLKEQFTDFTNSTDLFSKKLLAEPTHTPATLENPMGNVLLPELNANPNRKPAKLSYDCEHKKEINKMTKVSAIKNSDLDPRLFKDLGDQLEFDFSMRNFHTTPNTTVPNDQKSFAEFCYGNMSSCKEGDSIQCSKNISRIGTQYT